MITTTKKMQKEYQPERSTLNLCSSITSPNICRCSGKKSESSTLECHANAQIATAPDISRKNALDKGPIGSATSKGSSTRACTRKKCLEIGLKSSTIRTGTTEGVDLLDPVPRRPKDVITPQDDLTTAATMQTMKVEGVDPLHPPTTTTTTASSGVTEGVTEGVDPLNLDVTPNTTHQTGKKVGKVATNMAPSTLNVEMNRQLSKKIKSTEASLPSSRRIKDLTRAKEAEGAITTLPTLETASQDVRKTKASHQNVAMKISDHALQPKETRSVTEAMKIQAPTDAENSMMKKTSKRPVAEESSQIHRLHEDQTHRAKATEAINPFIISWNCSHGLSSKIDYVKELITRFKPMVMFISECELSLNDEINLNYFYIAGYNLVHSNTRIKRGDDRLKSRICEMWMKT